MARQIPTIDIKKYGGKQVAVIEGKIIAVGNSLKEVIEKAQRKEPAKPVNEIKIFSVPKIPSILYEA